MLENQNGGSPEKFRVNSGEMLRMTVIALARHLKGTEYERQIAELADIGNPELNGYPSELALKQLDADYPGAVEEAVKNCDEFITILNSSNVHKPSLKRRRSQSRTT